MADSTTPIIAVGAITMVNRSIFNGKPVDWKVPIATGISVGMFALLEKAVPKMAVALAWTAVLAITITRIDPSVPSPAESGLNWFNKIQG